jgi:hypothetical protein
MTKILATIRTRAKKMGPNCPNCQPTGGNGGPIVVSPAKLDLPAGRTPYLNGQALSARDLVSAARPKRTASDTKMGRPGGDALKAAPDAGLCMRPFDGRVAAESASLDECSAVLVLDKEYILIPITSIRNNAVPSGNTDAHS